MSSNPLTECMWYCNSGHNAFSSRLYTEEDPPECAACGSVMSSNASGFEEAIGQIEEAGIAAIEAENARSQQEDAQ